MHNYEGTICFQLLLLIYSHHNRGYYNMQTKNNLLKLLKGKMMASATTLQRLYNIL